MADPAQMPWWQRGVLYQIYARSFQDSNGDGIGDLPGITSRLDYLQWLGIDAIWLGPIYPSPNADWGYDVTDYYAVHPDLGTLDDLRRLIFEAGKRRIKVLLDLIPGHTSSEHPWFQDARSARDARHRDWYIWSEGEEPPNAWQAGSAAPAWTYDPTTRSQYLHTFLPEQPDLNWSNEEVRAEFDRILEYWFKIGVAGFRIDAAAHFAKTSDFGAPPWGHWGRPPADVSQVHEILRRWRQGAARHSERFLLGQTWIEHRPQLGQFLGEHDELHAVIDFAMLQVPFYADVMRGLVASVEDALPHDAFPVWCASSHDTIRFPTRWGAGDERKGRLGMLILLTLRGTPLLYYGDEIGMQQGLVRTFDSRDHWARDGCRTPMQWSRPPRPGFSLPSSQTSWLPMADHQIYVDDQIGSAESTLELCRDLIALRRASPDLVAGDYAVAPSPQGTWVWRRGESITVVANLTGMHAALTELQGTVRICTDRRRDGESVDGRLRLAPWEGAIVAR
jgi:alpha-glucosidase